MKSVYRFGGIPHSYKTGQEKQGVYEHYEQSVGEFVAYYNHQRYHESLSNLTSADVNFGRGQAILEEWRKIKEKIIQSRRIQHQLEPV